MDRAYAGPLDVPALARRAGVSRAHFTRSFKLTFGETPHQYLMSRRMERAKSLLRAGELSVTDVCFAVGFSSLGSFSTQFRRFVGESPSAYRARPVPPELARLPACVVSRLTRPLLS
jgi:AraC-like DNA-binding protein